jgi:hypothetical protein
MYVTGRYCVVSYLELVLRYTFLYGYLSRTLHRVIHKSLRDFRPLRYSNRDGYAEGEHINR